MSPGPLRPSGKRSVKSRLVRSAVEVSFAIGLVASSGYPAGAASLENVEQYGSLRLCANPAAPPYSKRSTQDGLPGFQIEMAEAVAHEMGLGLTVVWVRAPKAGQPMGCDAFMDLIALAPLHAREGRIGPLRPGVLPLRFSKPYATSGISLVVRSDSPVGRFEELGGQKVGVVVGSIEHELLARKGLNVSVFAFQEEIVAAVDAGEVDAGAVPAPVVGWYRHEHPNTTVRIPEGYVLEPELRWNVAIGLWRPDDALIEAVNAAIDRVLEKRIPGLIYARYGVPYEAPDQALEARER
jgi:polar amino acid transport system substrate-binding protein